MKDLFGIEVVPVSTRKAENQTAKVKHQQLINLYGQVNDSCKNCKNFYVKQYSGRYFKCKMADPELSSGPAGDWRANWKACGKFEK